MSDNVAKREKRRCVTGLREREELINQLSHLFCGFFFGFRSAANGVKSKESHTSINPSSLSWEKVKKNNLKFWRSACCLYLTLSLSFFLSSTRFELRWN
jgi:hypothetical protein